MGCPDTAYYPDTQEMGTEEGSGRRKYHNYPWHLDSLKSAGSLVSIDSPHLVVTLEAPKEVDKDTKKDAKKDAPKEKDKDKKDKKIEFLTLAPNAFNPNQTWQLTTLKTADIGVKATTKESFVFW